MVDLIEFPADDLERARRFWQGLLDVQLEAGARARAAASRRTPAGRSGVHERGPGPGDRVSLPYFRVADLAAALERVAQLGGELIHPGERWAICRDPEGSPFGASPNALRRKPPRAVWSC